VIRDLLKRERRKERNDFYLRKGVLVHIKTEETTHISVGKSRIISISLTRSCAPVVFLFVAIPLLIVSHVHLPELPK